jgi:hypothetical protein
VNDRTEPTGIRFWVELAIAWMALPLILLYFVACGVWDISRDCSRAIAGVAYRKIVGAFRRHKA